MTGRPIEREIKTSNRYSRLNGNGNNKTKTRDS